MTPTCINHPHGYLAGRCDAPAVWWLAWCCPDGHSATSTYCQTCYEAAVRGGAFRGRGTCNRSGCKAWPVCNNIITYMEPVKIKERV